jgi:hypothetical protein
MNRRHKMLYDAPTVLVTVTLRTRSSSDHDILDVDDNFLHLSFVLQGTAMLIGEQ